MSATLPNILHKRGFTLTRIAREGILAIYRQTWDGAQDEASAAFEVIRIRTQPPRESNLGGVNVKWPGGEVYPSSEQWGVNGFTLTTRDAAFAKLKELKGAA